MKNIWVISDTHFSHANIIKYCNRPFVNSFQMNSVMRMNWNSAIGEDDTVIHLGDLALVPNSKFDEMKQFINTLNGKLIVLLGNHDKKHFLEHCGIVYTKRLVCGNLLLRHYPQRMGEKMANNVHIVHGHIHNNGYDQGVKLTCAHTCVSVEMTEYKPVLLNSIANFDEHLLEKTVNEHFHSGKINNCQ